ncbi:MAG: hypothetical protein CR961_01430 [Polaribacter sp.]|nr:MAG: hypothetical protein CR961_01430 [Polaribacter sp.]
MKILSIEAIKKEDEQRRQRLANSNNFGGSSKGFLGLGSRGKWYFYNTQSKQIGKADFKRVWGNRQLKDNWRYSEQVNMILDNESNNEVAQNQSRYKLETYLDAIPTNEKEIKKLKEERNNALYKTGLSYKESFKNTKLAIARLERLNAINTNKDIELPIHYHLYQLYSKVEDLNKAGKMKGFILREYPMSKYAELLKSPNGKITNEPKEEDEVSKMYKNAYYLYKKGKFQETIDWIDSVSSKVGKSNLIPKFALLKAMAIGKTRSKEEYLKVLQFIVYNYADTIEGKKAKEIIELLKSKK